MFRCQYYSGIDLYLLIITVIAGLVVVVSTNVGIHLQCCVGSKVHMRVGGDFYFDPKPGDSCPDLLLIAGGVGINPIYSIVRHVADISQYQHTGRTVLLFSAQNQDELLFKVHVHQL